MIDNRIAAFFVYGAIVVLALAGVALIMLLPERSTAVGLVYQGF